MQKKISLIQLFWIFFKISCVLFGGGYAILPFLKSEIVEKTNICTFEEIADYYALSQCFPGLVAGNLSILIGYKTKGILGAITCLTGICLPAYLSIILIFSFLNTLIETPFTQNIFELLDIAICILIFITTIELWSRAVKDKFTTSIFLLALILTIYNISPFIVILTAGFLGIIRYFVMINKKPKGETSA